MLPDAAFWAKAQGNAPQLTVDPPVISKWQTVTLNCQTPVKEPQCHFKLDQKYYKPGCQTVLRGTELLSMVKKRTPAKISVTCYYTLNYYPNYRSDRSDARTITIALGPPSLTVNSSVISETDNVELRCQPPSSVYSDQCHFYATNGQNWNNSDCEQTVKGSDLLMVNQSPPVQVQIRCYYVVNFGAEVSTSLRSEKISVTVQRRTQQLTKPEISFDLDKDEVIIICSLPQSTTGSKCNLYFGESTQPYQTMNAQFSPLCQFFVSVNDFCTNLQRVQTKDVSCDYTLVNGLRSPRSDGPTSRDFISKLFPNVSPETTASAVSVKTTTGPSHVTGSDSESRTSVTHVTTASFDPVKTTPGHETGSDITTSKSDLLPSRPRGWNWLMLFVWTVMALSLLFAMILCYQRKIYKLLGKSSRGKNSDDINSGALPLSERVDRSSSSPTATVYCSPGSSSVNKEELHDEDDYESTV